MSESRSRHESRQTFVPAIDDILSPPPPPTEPSATPAQPQGGSLGFIVVTANILVTGIIVVGMLVEGQQASRAIITGAAYFAGTTVIHIFVITGALSAIVSVWQHERTERHRIEAYAKVAEQAIGWRMRIEDNRTLELQAQALPADLTRRLAQVENDLLDQRLTAGGVQTPNANTFVAAYDNRGYAAFAQEGQADTTAQEAMEWARCLYLDTTGAPDPAQVYTTGDQVGWLRVRMLGSRRGTGSKEAGLWLLHRKIILRVPGGYKLNLAQYPRRESLRVLL